MLLVNASGKPRVKRSLQQTLKGLLIRKGLVSNCIKYIYPPLIYRFWLHLWFRIFKLFLYMGRRSRDRIVRSDEVYSMQHYGQWLSKGRWFSPGTPVYSTNKTDRYDITGILFKVALNTINPTHRTLFLYSGLHVTFTNFSLSEPLITFTLCITVVESWT
jgi:hypothetical protein